MYHVNYAIRKTENFNPKGGYATESNRTIALPHLTVTVACESLDEADKLSEVLQMTILDFQKREARG